MKINLSGRTDTKDYFLLSGIREFKKLSHHPCLVFLEEKDGVSVEIVDSAKKLIEFPDSIKVMAQWEGKWGSDFFQFTVGDFKEYLQKNPRKDYYIV